MIDETELTDDELQTAAVAAFYVPVGGGFAPYPSQEPPHYLRNLDAAWGLLQKFGAERPVSLHGHIFEGVETWVCHIPPMTVIDSSPARAIVRAALEVHHLAASPFPASGSRSIAGDLDEL